MSLLPANATVMDAALEHAIALLSDTPNPIDTLWDPWRCPARLLPWLAWQYSVDYWRMDWPENVKRQVIDRAYAVHRIKGTVPALMDAIAGLGIEAKITRWWETQPKGAPYTMSVTAMARPASDDAVALDAQGQQDLRDVIDATKALRTDVAVQIEARTSTTLGLAAVARSQQSLTAALRLPQGVRTALGVVAGADGMRILTARANAPAGQRLALALAAGSDGCPFSSLRMTVQ